VLATPLNVCYRGKTGQQLLSPSLSAFDPFETCAAQGFRSAKFMFTLGSAAARPLAVTRLPRSPLFPELPTLDEAGVTSFDMDSWAGIVAAGRRRRRSWRSSTASCARSSTIPTSREARQVSFGAFSSTPDAVGDFIKVQLDKWGKKVKDARIQPE